MIVAPKMPDPSLPVFLAISSYLTGYSEDELEGTGMLSDFFATLMKEQDHEGVRRFLLKAEEVLELRDCDAIQAAIRMNFIDLPSTAVRPNTPFEQMHFQGLAQRITILWYTGAWTTMNGLEIKSQDDRTVIVSGRAYVNSLVWVTAQTHPAGAKQPGFGSWSVSPSP
jgi:hypothetical protein